MKPLISMFSRFHILFNFPSLTKNSQTHHNNTLCVCVCVCVCVYVSVPSFQLFNQLTFFFCEILYVRYAFRNHCTMMNFPQSGMVRWKSCRHCIYDWNHDNYERGHLSCSSTVVPALPPVSPVEGVSILPGESNYRGSHDCLEKYKIFLKTVLTL
jgi:hypothetical protein